MPVAVVVGGQFGSEGKGKTAHFLLQQHRDAIAVRVGGSNSGHTIMDESGNIIIYRALPTAACIGDVTCVVPPGAYIDLEVLLAEIQRDGLAPERLHIDPHAVLITERESASEKCSGLVRAIGSTASGTGMAVMDRISRSGRSRFASQEPLLTEYLMDTAGFLRRAVSIGRYVLIEGTQGFGLSVLHSSYYPYVTSRDTTASSFLSEAGLSPLDVSEVHMVIRAFPIRVGGNSGPLPRETTWERVTLDSGSPINILEHTTVTGRVRRVAKFDGEVVREAIKVNNPTHIFLNHVDYINYLNKKSRQLTPDTIKWVESIEKEISREIDYFGTCPASYVCREQACTRLNLSVRSARVMRIAPHEMIGVRS